MKIKILIQEAWLVYEDWEKRKAWTSDFSGPHTTPEEDKMAGILLYLIHRVKK